MTQTLTSEIIKSKSTIDPKTGCWNWNGKPDSHGYGRIRHLGERWRIHRLMWSLCFGEIPTGMLVCHECDNRPCCNPEHLFVGTNLDNIRDCVRKGRKAVGEDNGRSKMTASQVVEVVTSKESGIKIAKRLGVTAPNVYAIRKGKTWKHITGIKL